MPRVFPVPWWAPTPVAMLAGVPILAGPTPRRRWYSHYGQDRWVMMGGGRGRGYDVSGDESDGKKGGYFVELGAHDGVGLYKLNTVDP